MAKVNVVLVNDGQVVVEDLFASFLIAKSGGTNCIPSIQESNMAHWVSTGATGNDISIVSRQSFRLAPRGIISIAIMTLEAAPPFDAEAHEIQFVTGCGGAPPHSETFRTTGIELQQLFIASKQRMADPFAKANTNWQDYSRRFLGISD